MGEGVNTDGSSPLNMVKTGKNSNRGLMVQRNLINSFGEVNTATAGTNTDEYIKSPSKNPQYTLGSILARDYDRSHKKLSGGGSMFKRSMMKEA